MTARLNKYFPWIAAVLLLLLATTLWHRVEDFDDGWFAEQSYFFMKEGFVRSQLFAEWGDLAQRQFVYHKLSIYIGSLLFSIFGFSLLTAKAVGLLGFLFSLGVGYLYFKKFGDRTQFSIFAIFLAGIDVTFRYVFIFRQEFWVVGFALLSFYFLRSFLQSKRRSDLIYSGLAAGFAPLVHLNGLCFMIAGFLVIWHQRRKFWEAVLFGFASLLSLSLYTWDLIATRNGFSRWIAEFIRDKAIQGGESFSAKLERILEFINSFFHSGSVAVVSLMVVIFAIGLGRKQKLSLSFLYLLASLLGFALILNRNTQTYFLLFAPFLAICIAEAWTMTAPAWLQRTKIALLALHVASAVWISVRWFQINQQPLPQQAWTEIGELILPQSPDSKPRVYGPHGLIFPFIDQMNIQSNNVIFHELGGRALEKGPELSTWLRQRNVDWLVLEDVKLADYPRVPQPAPERVGDLVLHKQIGRYVIYRLQK